MELLLGMGDLPLGPGPVASVAVAGRRRVPVLVVVVVLVDLTDLLRDDLVVDLRVVDDPMPSGFSGTDGSGSRVPGVRATIVRELNRTQSH